ncbi:hypothetical protein A2U01_0092472, partial [Trifolium medium]|nr:hypothetical protein [Trifolium medium]
MMSINCSSWLSSCFSAAIDGINGHQRPWPSAGDYIYSTHTLES